MISGSNGAIDRAAIISADGEILTSQDSPNSLKLTPQESSTIASVIKNEDLSSFYKNGINVEGVKYQFYGGADALYGKALGKGMIVIEKSSSSIVIGHIVQEKQQKSATRAANQVVETLRSVGM